MRNKVYERIAEPCKWASAILDLYEGWSRRNIGFRHSARQYHIIGEGRVERMSCLSTAIRSLHSGADSCFAVIVLAWSILNAAVLINFALAQREERQFVSLMIIRTEIDAVNIAPAIALFSRDIRLLCDDIFDQAIFSPSNKFSLSWYLR